MMKRTFESGLVIGGGLGASTVMFALALCEGFTSVMELGAVSIVVGLVAMMSVSRLPSPRG
ncbi:hypothetical protein [Paraburkholderia fungorum]|uniref:hypothetical protein n=1 Tax=Paraburkholderia fungorum TaxID=134537 RepID=UPI00161D4B06|nr:hypothetical protein [Paraburkholderia fungorum]MBB5546657.1 hypothetical protein [Paraburkholderia fungorum]